LLGLRSGIAGFEGENAMDTRMIWAVLAGGACATAGAGLVMLLRAEHASPAAAPEHVAAPRPTEVAPLERVELAALVEELRRLREELASRREAVGDGGATPASASLQDQLSELRALLERRAAPAPATELDLSSKGPRRAELFVRSGDPATWTDDGERIAKQCRLWSPQRVLDEFGMPDRVVNYGGSLRWVYSASELPQVFNTKLDFVGGYLVNAWVDDS
jgi:hypothetical protein